MSSTDISDSKQESSIRYYLRDLLDRTKDEKSVDLVLEDIGRHYDADNPQCYACAILKQQIYEAQYCRQYVKPMDRKIVNHSLP